MSRRETTGKLSAGRLKGLLERYAPCKDPAVVVGPGIGLDAAAVDVSAGILVFASDPVTYASAELGRYAVHVNANDVYVCGAEPLWFLADILLPPGDVGAAEKIFKQVHQACEELGVSLIGGHTEFTPGLGKPLVAGFMIGRPLGDGVVSAAGVRPGDSIILTKGIAIEGTAIIGSEGGPKRLEKLSQATVRRAKRLLRDPGISVGPEARIAVGCGAKAMHDPTEGGLLNGLWEMAEASGLALQIDVGAVPVYPETKAVCECFGIDPLGLLASGALLVACSEHDAQRFVEAASTEGISAFLIGKASRGEVGVHLSSGRVLKQSVADEILKVFDSGE